jgi:hypothetical protein
MATTKSTKPATASAKLRRNLNMKPLPRGPKRLPGKGFEMVNR